MTTVICASFGRIVSKGMGQILYFTKNITVAQNDRIFYFSKMDDIMVERIETNWYNKK